MISGNGGVGAANRFCGFDGVCEVEEEAGAVIGGSPRPAARSDLPPCVPTYSMYSTAVLGIHGQRIYGTIIANEIKCGMYDNIAVQRTRTALVAMLSKDASQQDFQAGQFRYQDHQPSILDIH